MINSVISSNMNSGIHHADESCDPSEVLLCFAGIRRSQVGSGETFIASLSLPIPPSPAGSGWSYLP